MRLPRRPHGASAEIILNLIDLGLRPLIVAAAMSITPQYVYIVLKKNGRIKGDGRSEEIVRRYPDGWATLTPYLERIFFDCRSAFDLMDTVARAQEKVRRELTPVKRPRGRPPISRASVPKVASSARGRRKPTTFGVSGRDHLVGGNRTT